ncbi:hypothetical protein B0F90DRAFT_1100977 [Multifurca ochricompacta]|uniref:BTB domain-containing protein n=1 Tax=Multifurca ochricompacta TaxID=376703 RepID=A0AAD4M949_9AGAM|nr:hypothetical protein B0F90DRAFT_1100977 [Multifurca ochricompacta]
MSSPTDSFLSSKRPRIHKSTSGDEIKTYESPDLWFEDGNIIIRTVLHDKAYTVYKVHKSILASHSSVFLDLFDGPQAAFDTASERYEGLPVIGLPDPPSDVNDFLKALYFPEETHCHRPISFPFLEGIWKGFPYKYLGILHLAMKYDVAHLREYMLGILRDAWPQYLFDWDYLQKHTEDLERAYLRRECFDLSFAHPEPARTIRLAMDHNVLDILPIAFYDLVRVHEVIAPNPHEGFRRADLSVLTADDLRRLTQGRGALRGKFLEGINNLLIVLPHDDCKWVPVPGKSSPCHAGLRKWWDAQLGAVSGPSVADPIGWLREKVGICDDIPHDEVCSGCTRVVKKYLQTVREDLWTSLPEFFGLGLLPSNWGQETEPKLWF